MKEMIVAIRMDHPIWSSSCGVIRAPAPMGVVAAIAMSPPPKSIRVPMVSIASRILIVALAAFVEAELRLAL